MSYNGWGNYETWAVKLWLDNERGSYYEMTGEATRRIGEARELEQDASPSDFADYIKQYIEDGAPDLDVSIYFDLLRAALSEVDWFEIAESYLADAKEESA